VFKKKIQSSIKLASSNSLPSANVVEDIVKSAAYMDNFGSTIFIKWKAPPTSILKFNVNGVLSKMNDLSTCDRLVLEMLRVTLSKISTAMLVAIIFRC
jgi:hypothetical protein